MSEDFKNYVTGGAFQLTLSKGMIESLAYVSVGYHKPDISFNMHALGGLQRRGLIEWRTKKARRNSKIVQIKTGPFITKAGKLVLQLCEMAELTCTESIELGPRLKCHD